jgi:hypothetical protein
VKCVAFAPGIFSIKLEMLAGGLPSGGGGATRDSGRTGSRTGSISGGFSGGGAVVVAISFS